MTNKHLSLEERHYIAVQHKKGVSINDIAKTPDRAQSSISRELARNRRQRGYRYK